MSARLGLVSAIAIASALVACGGSAPAKPSTALESYAVRHVLVR